MEYAVAIVADDLTGAADTGSAFATAGLSTIVSWSRIALAGARFDADVVSLDLETRIGDAVSAQETTLRVVRTLRHAGARAIYKKCDSMLRGHIGEEVAAAISAWHPSSLGLVAPAFPAAGRVTIAGRQHVDGVALDRPAIASTLQDAGLSIRSVDLETIRRSGLDEWLHSCRAARIDAVVFDAETADDVRAIARAGARLGPAVVWVGSGGLARALPEALKLSRAAAPDVTPDIVASGPILFVVGSTSKIARLQAGRLVASGVRHVPVAIEVLVGTRGTDDEAGIANEILHELRDGRDVLVTPGGLDDVNVREKPMAARLGEMLRPCASAARGVVVTGGDTATGILRAFDTSALRLIDEIEPGVPLALSVAPRPLAVVTKAGAFGDALSLVRAGARLRGLFT